MYPPATTATLRNGFMALAREGRLSLRITCRAKHRQLRAGLRWRAQGALPHHPII